MADFMSRILEKLLLKQTCKLLGYASQNYDLLTEFSLLSVELLALQKNHCLLVCWMVLCQQYWKQLSCVTNVAKKLVSRCWMVGWRASEENTI